ncbi:hypothetical protein Poly51_14770 [Rubripirellula tenax]|uniref:Ice-binding protein C-terminal domain-containing protein n=1 Tax=Rubripirellula tenax TaxID=2528015 RepID=A0A5C6FB82_9BACT|nr:PEP-CTERM sorting domain-containing protein [Rubripirellula tenax]TWU58698.1 hypothetical protein Poly51_14770 [Rubripirellula tenax]
MKILSFGLGLLIAGSMLVSTASAAVVISAPASGPIFEQDSGIQSVDVFARWNGIGDPAGIALTVDFSLGNGATFDTPSAGIFDRSGLIGNGNIISAGSSFNRDTTNPGVAYLSIEYDLPQTFPTDDALLTTLSINTNGLAPGTYAVNIDDAQLDGNLGVFTGGSFQIVAAAVPEPGSFVALAAAGVALWVRRRRKAKQFASVAA